MNTPTTAELVSRFELKPHPEGGYFRETYRAARMSRPEGFPGPRPYSTAIVFLLPEGKRSKLHRIRSDEVWHHYLGGPLTIAEIPPDGKVRRTVLGREIASGQRLQHVVPAGHWFGAVPEPGSGYALLGCTVAPGFDFSDFELAKRSELLRRYPSAREIIEPLTDPCP